MKGGESNNFAGLNMFQELCQGATHLLSHTVLQTQYIHCPPFTKKNLRLRKMPVISRHIFYLSLQVEKTEYILPFMHT